MVIQLLLGFLRGLCIFNPWNPGGSFTDQKNDYNFPHPRLLRVNRSRHSIFALPIVNPAQAPEVWKG